MTTRTTLDDPQVALFTVEDGRVRSVGQHAGGPAAVTAFRAQRPGPGTPSLPAAGALP